MILQRQITQWRSKAPWPYLDQVEHDLVLSRAICDLYASPVVSENLVFRGGTALHKLFFDKPGRFSEDLDFVQRKAMPIGDTASAVRSCLDPWLGQPKWKQNEGRFTLYYRFETEVEPIIQRKLKIEINTREHFSVMPLEKFRFDVDTEWYKNSVTVLTYKLEEQLGTKLRALYQRRKGRDLFDFWYAFKQNKNIDADKLVKIFIAYMNNGRTPVIQKQFLENLAIKKESKAFNEDIKPLLSPDIVKQYKVDEAYDLLFDHIIPKII